VTGREGWGVEGRDGKGKEWKVEERGWGKGREGSAWIFAQGPPSS